jgi:hypothetical protein
MDQIQQDASIPAPSRRTRLSSVSSAVRADLLDPLLDELISIGSHGSELRLHDSQHSIGSPMNRSLSSPNHFTLSPNWRLTNPVHMEIQENAKLPTFNLDVDRTGSSTYPRVPVALEYLSSPSHDSHDAPTSGENGRKGQKKTSKRTSLAERFLLPASRQSLHTVYAKAGALREHQDRQVSQAVAHSSAQSSARTSRAGSVADEKKAEHADHFLFVGGPLIGDGWDVDPTPLSEIHRKHCSSTGHRKLQLPIPFLPPSPLASPRGAACEMSPGRQFAAELASNDATATSAAISSNAILNGSMDKSPSHPPPLLLPNAALGTEDASGVKRQSTSMSTDRSSTQRRRLNDGSSPSQQQDRSALISATPLHHSATSSMFLSSIERASKQKSQYGFGPKHVVPSVPASLEAARIATKPRTATDAQQQRRIRDHTNSESKSYRSDSPHGSVSTANQQASINSGPAYERKKQKAKDARVRLNESIEKLSIAISFAGTQSKQRLEQWNSMVASQSSGADAANDSNRLRSVLQDCVHHAEEAKKWDRPSFVGSAAMLIESLSAQCEVLMREVSTLRSDSEAQLAQPTDGATCGVVPGSDATHDLGLPLNAESEAMTEPAVESLPEIPIDLGEEVVAWGGSKITARIAAFLDPVSLSRCNLVSKPWRRDFSSRDTWSDLAIQRFGYYNVRQWKGKLEDDDEGITCNPFALYNSMDKSNTMPHFSRDGLFLLGEAYLPGKVSVWTFLVERSNGETHRSVLRPDSAPESGMYTSLPVVELRTVIQNTGSNDGPVLIREQPQTVDASTRRRGVEMKEIDWDDRFRRTLLNLDGTTKLPPNNAGSTSAYDASNVLCALHLFEAVVISTFIHAKGCSTMSKFVQKSNYTKFHVQIRNGTTIPLVVSFPRDLSHHLEH